MAYVTGPINPYVTEIASMRKEAICMLSINEYFNSTVEATKFAIVASSQSYSIVVAEFTNRPAAESFVTNDPQGLLA